jgi:hypothetical protein
MRKGVPARIRRAASRNMSICVTNRSARGSRRFTVKKKVPPGTPIAAIIRHTGSMPELSELGLQSYNVSQATISSARSLTQILCPSHHETARPAK